MKNTRANKTRSNIIIFVTFAIATILLLGYSPNTEVAEQPKVSAEYRHDKIPAEEIEKTNEWLRAQNLQAQAECTEVGVIEEIPEETELQEDDEYELLCRLVWAESTRKDKNEMVAIAATVLNRVEEDKFPDNITDVIFESGQFSPAADGEIYWFPEANVQALVQDNDVTDDVRLAVDLALKGEDPTEVMINGGALFYFSDRYISDAERQKRENIGDSVKFGDTIFYRTWEK